MTTVESIQAKQAREILDQGNGSVLVDVRTQAEYNDGHAPGSLNIPLLDLDATGAMAVNADFLRVVRAHVPPSANVILVCRSGHRSAQAGELLAEAGYEHVANLVGGIHGHRDWTGRLIDPGWTAAGFPLTRESDKSATYPALAASTE